jgi:hypothetical protein
MMVTIRLANRGGHVRRLAWLGGVVLTAACYPGDGPTNVEGRDVVVTAYDPDVDYRDYETFAMPDTVVHFTDEDDDDVIDLPRDYDDMVLELVADNMDMLGYVRELDPETNGTDLVLLVGAVGTSSTSWYMGGGWWGWWGYYPGYPGWGWYYPPYWGSVTIEQGTIVLFLVDPNRGDGTDEARVVWSGAARGLLSESSTSGSRVTNAVNQMFDQSPYLSNRVTIQ